MTLPTQTWRVSAKYPVAVAGASITNNEIFAGIKAMMDGEDALGNNYWTYASSSYSNTTTQVMIFKRKGSPSGTLASFRAGLFATNGTPNTGNAVTADFTLATGVLYMSSSENHNSDAVASVFTAGQVFSGKHSKMGPQCVTLSTNFNSTSGTKCFMVECDTMCSIWFVSSSVTIAGMHLTFGEIAERVESANGVWGNIHSIAMTAAQTGIEVTANALVPACNYTTATIIGGTFYCNLASVARPWGRLNSVFHTAGLEDSLQNYNNTVAAMIPIIMGSKLTTGASQPQYTVGVLRQMRFGPRIQGQQVVRDTADNLKGYSIAPGYNTTSRSLYYDNAP